MPIARPKTRRVIAVTLAVVSGVLLSAPPSTLASGGVAAAPSPASSVPGAFSAYFKAHCGYAHTLSDDPIMFPGQFGVSHSHDFAGNVSTNGLTTTASLLASPSNCDDQGDRSGYWMPTLYQNGSSIHPTAADAYYTNGGKVGLVQPFPVGLRMIAGDRLATSPQPTSLTTWACLLNKTVIMAGAAVPLCPAGGDLLLHVRFPDCWDGIHLDTADHKSHMARSSANGTCPASHPVPVPELFLTYRYPTRGGTGITLSSGGQYSAHADFMNAWDPTVMAQHVTGCINGGVVCVVGTSPAPRPTAPVMLGSGSFEATAAGWNVAPGSNFVDYHDSTVAHDGGWYGATNTVLPGGGIFQDVFATVNPGDAYTATAWLRAQDVPANGLLCLWTLGGTAENNCQPYAVTSAGWTQYQIVLNPAAAHAGLRLQLYTGAGTTRIDTATLQRDRLRSGSFEATAAGWNVAPGSNFVDYHDSTVAHDGGWYGATNTVLPGGGIFQDVFATVNPGDAYTATAWLRAQDVPANGLLCLWTLGGTAENNCQPYAVTSAGWTQYQIVLNPAAAHAGLRLQLYTGAGTTRIDTATLQRDRLRSGSFEATAAGWNVAPGSNFVDYHDSTVAHDGGWYGATNTVLPGGGIFQDVFATVNPGDAYTATAWLRAQDVPANGLLCLWTLGGTAENNCQPYAVTSAGWTQYQIVLNPAAAHAGLRLQLYTGAGTTRIDTAAVR